MQRRTTITVASQAEKWRFTCPRGHCNWFPIDGHFRCRACAQQRNAGEHDVDPEVDRLWDQRDERWIDRDEIELAIERGPQRAPSVPPHS